MAYFLFLGQFFYYTKGVSAPKWLISSFWASSFITQRGFLPNNILLLGCKKEKRSRISYICRNVVFTFSKIVITFLESNSYISQRFPYFYKGFPTLYYIGKGKKRGRR